MYCKTTLLHILIAEAALRPSCSSLCVRQQCVRSKDESSTIIITVWYIVHVDKNESLQTQQPLRKIFIVRWQHDSRSYYDSVSPFVTLASTYSTRLSRVVSFSFKLANLVRHDISNELRKSVIFLMLHVINSIYSRFAQSCWICFCICVICACGSLPAIFPYQQQV